MGSQTMMENNVYSPYITRNSISYLTRTELHSKEKTWQLTILRTKLQFRLLYTQASLRTGHFRQRLFGARTILRTNICWMGLFTYLITCHSYLYCLMKQGSIPSMLMDIKQFSPAIVKEYESRRKQIIPVQ